MLEWVQGLHVAAKASDYILVQQDEKFGRHEIAL